MVFGSLLTVRLGITQWQTAGIARPRRSSTGDGTCRNGVEASQAHIHAAAEPTVLPLADGQNGAGHRVMGVDWGSGVMKGLDPRKPRSTERSIRPHSMHFAGVVQNASRG